MLSNGSWMAGTQYQGDSLTLTSNSTGLTFRVGGRREQGPPLLSPGWEQAPVAHNHTVALTQWHSHSGTHTAHTHLFHDLSRDSQVVDRRAAHERQRPHRLPERRPRLLVRIRVPPEAASCILTVGPDPCDAYTVALPPSPCPTPSPCAPSGKHCQRSAIPAPSLRSASQRPEALLAAGGQGSSRRRHGHW